MAIFLFTFGIIALAMLGMAVGLIARGRSIRAGCGRSPEAEDIDAGCEVCDGSCEADREPELARGLRSSPQ